MLTLGFESIKISKQDIRNCYSEGNIVVVLPYVRKQNCYNQQCVQSRIIRQWYTWNTLRHHCFLDCVIPVDALTSQLYFPTNQTGVCHSSSVAWRWLLWCSICIVA